jgi:hypothetical protein
MAEAVHHNRATSTLAILSRVARPECIIKFVETKCHIAHNGYRHQSYFILPAQTSEEEAQEQEKEGGMRE